MEQSCLLLANAVILGFRHGIDWDHIAAIMDIVGSVPTSKNASLPVRRPLLISSMYALGHASVVAVLGLAALYFSAILPTWIDPLMERLVGFTLLLLGAWVGVSLIQHFLGKESFRFRSRWMLILTLIAKTRNWVISKFTGQEMVNSFDIGDYSLHTAFGIGMIHGIGAETGTQVLLIAAIGGAASHGLGAAMLISFIVGLLISNTLVALCGTAGYISARKLKPLYITAGALTCGFSFVIGFYFVLEQEPRLPDLRLLFGHAQGTEKLAE